MKNATALHSRALRLASRGNYSAATTAYRRALRLAENYNQCDPLFLATVLNDFGVLCKYTGQFALAARMYRRALTVVVRESPNDKQFLATLYHNLGGLEHARGCYFRGLRHARRGVAFRKALRPRDSLALVADEAALAAILVDLGRTSEATKIYYRVLRSYRHALGSGHYEVGAVWANLGALYSKTAQLDAAECAFRHAVSILETAVGRNHPRIASALNNLAVVFARQGKFREAGALYGRVLRVLERQSRSTYPPISLVRENYKKLREMERRAASSASGRSRRLRRDSI